VARALEDEGVFDEKLDDVKSLRDITEENETESSKVEALMENLKEEARDDSKFDIEEPIV
jgi:hypothetical protein